MSSDEDDSEDDEDDEDYEDDEDDEDTTSSAFIARFTKSNFNNNYFYYSPLKGYSAAPFSQ